VLRAVDGDIMLTLFVPAIAVSLVFFAILFGVPASAPQGRRQPAGFGFGRRSLGLLLITAGLVFLRLSRIGELELAMQARVVVLVVAVLAGAAVLWAFARWELRHPDPAIDLRVMRQPAMWPVLVTAGLFGISVLGAQAPLLTYARSEERRAGKEEDSGGAR